MGESPNQLTENDGPFKRLLWIPIEDLVLIPSATAIECVAALHEAVCDGDSNVYIHCIAGWNRSPTILWLYLAACGVEPEAAANLIGKSSYDAIPNHPKLIDSNLVNTICEYGAANFRPHPRPTALDAII